MIRIERSCSAESTCGLLVPVRARSFVQDCYWF